MHRLSIVGYDCVHCGATMGEAVLCPGCGWIDPFTHRSSPESSPGASSSPSRDTRGEDGGSEAQEGTQRAYADPLAQAEIERLRAKIARVEQLADYLDNAGEPGGIDIREALADREDHRP